jgi:hypothetical protein
MSDDAIQQSTLRPSPRQDPLSPAVLSDLIARAGVSLAEVGRCAGKTRQAVHLIVHGRRRLQPWVLPALRTAVTARGAAGLADATRADLVSDLLSQLTDAELTYTSTSSAPGPSPPRSGPGRAGDLGANDDTNNRTT